MNAGEVNEDKQPLDQCTLTRLSRVCGLTSRQRVPLTLEKFEDLTEDEKNELFTKSIQRYIVYTEELKEKGKGGSYEGHLSFMEGLQKQTCDVSEKKAEPLREIQRLERRRL
jgi:hypothetical protein